VADVLHGCWCVESYYTEAQEVQHKKSIQDTYKANCVPVMQIEAVMSDFVRLREESSYLEGGVLLEGGNGMTDWMADDEDNYQLGESSGTS
jgi:hypothetical protein